VKRGKGPLMGIDFVIDDLACARDGKRTTFDRKEMARQSLIWIVGLLRGAGRHEEAAMYTRVYQVEP
jgi:hypothetical protein